MRFVSDSEENTEDFGECFVKKLKAGDYVYMYGGLGAGKTAFVRGMARGLNIKSRVTSPTYAIVNEYPDGKLPLFHFDLYRITGEDELFAIGFDDYEDRGGIIVCEWSENTEPKPGAFIIKIDKTGENSREITVSGGYDENTCD